MIENYREKKNNNTIIIAPTNFLAFKEYTIYKI